MSRAAGPGGPSRRSGVRRRRGPRGRGPPERDRGGCRGGHLGPLAGPLPPPDPPAGGRLGPLPVVGALDGPGRSALGQHHLHRLRRRPSPGCPTAPYDRLDPDLDLHRSAARLRGRRADSRQARRPAWLQAPLPRGPARRGGERGAHRVRPDRRGAHRRALARRGAGGGDRAPRRWRSCSRPSATRTGSRQWGGGPWSARAARFSG